jgi:hypothetical protein
MGIPQINESQVQRLVNMCGAINAFSEVVPEEKLDGPNYEHFMDELRDTEQLVILGLIREITDQCGEKLANIYSMTSRMFRVFEITNVGRAMFSKPDRTWVN